jgi:hypothetical protein
LAAVAIFASLFTSPFCGTPKTLEKIEAKVHECADVCLARTLAEGTRSHAPFATLVRLFLPACGEKKSSKLFCAAHVIILLFRCRRAIFTHFMLSAFSHRSRCVFRDQKQTLLLNIFEEVQINYLWPLM